MDISASMLSVALERDVEGDLLLADMGQGIPLRAGSIDAAISISAVQWLCNVDESGVSAEGRLGRFFGGLYAVLRRGGRAVCQFYPRDEKQRRMVCGAAVRAGFGAGVLEDEGGRKGKVYLVLSVGGGKIAEVVRRIEGVEVVEGGRGGREGMERKGGRKWILRRKERMERRGKVVKRDSKYTGRKRRTAW